MTRGAGLAALTPCRVPAPVLMVLIRNAAHEYFDDCLCDLAAEFFTRGSARDLDTACVDTLRRPPFVTL